ncbi:sensor histidine kinase [Frigoribacterium sp. UYMn621]|uniref:sensor histidine kinase n=2 Tax=Microbacteriaceae TaxID=85023 RepID=UPI0033961E2F
MTSTDSATLDPVTITVPRPRSLYGSLWRAVPRELGFLLLTLPLVIVSFTVLVTGISTGFGTLVTFFGIFLIIGSLWAARGFGMLELLRLRWAGRPAIAGPDWTKPTATGFWARLFGTLLNPHYWLYLLHGLVVNFAVGLFTWILSFTWTVVALSGLSYWFYSRFIPTGRGDWHVSDWIARTFAPGWTPDPVLADDLVFLAIGVIFAVTLPFITRGMTMLHYLVAVGMLGRFRIAELQGEVADLSASRTAAVSAEGTALRRLERDIHDGPQQRLVRLQMDLAAAERQLASDPDAARTLIAEARDQSREALEELRALSRGFAPPILLDRGLIAALESLAVRSPVPVTLVNALPTPVLLPQEIERNAYFVASELLTNVAKHASATSIALRVGLGDGGGLEISVTDDGRGGATVVAGHGLAGLEERLRGLGGHLVLKSPDGGSTVVSALLPLS